MHDDPQPSATSEDGWQPLACADLETVAQIAARLHPSLPERTPVLAEKRQLFPDGCRKLVFAGRMLGYALAHPWTLDRPPPLDDFLGALPDAADCLFIHDVAVLPEARGRGAAAAFLAHATAVAVARRLPVLALIAAYGTARLWQRFDFTPVAVERIAGNADAALAGYGADVRYLCRALPGQAAGD